MVFLEIHKKPGEKKALSTQQTLHIRFMWWNNILRRSPPGPYWAPGFPMVLPPTQAQCTLPPVGVTQREEKKPL